jgi:hypothetical protein
MVDSTRLLRSRTIAVTAAALATVLACDGAELECPARLTILEPVIQITSVTSNAGAVDGPFKLYDFSINGITPVTAELLADVPNTSATLSGDTIVCASVSQCGLGSSVGPYTFTLAASGFSGKVMTVNASYATRVKTGGCTTGLAGGTQVAVVLP